MKKITVFGATGMLGQPVVKELVKAGYEVTAMARNTEKARRVLPEEVRIIEGDLKLYGDVENALKDADATYLNLAVEPTSKQGDFQPEREGLDNILAAAKEHGIKRIAYLSSLVHRYQGMDGFFWWAFSIKQSAIEKIKSSGIAHTIFYPSNFMENLDIGNFKQGNRMMLAGESKYPVYFIAGEDYGKQVAKSFQVLGANENRDYTVQGLEAFTNDEAVKIFVENYEREKLKISKAPIFILKLLGTFNRKINYGAHILTAINNYPENFESESTWKELGKPQITLKEYARRAHSGTSREKQ